MKKFKSILQNDPDFCYICGMKATETHHCIGGTSRRKLADKDGLYVRLCHDCHQSLHDHNTQKERLQKIAQAAWMEKYGKSVDEWRERYIKSYL